MLQGLEAPAGALVVMDRGIATEENIAWLRAQGYRYLVVSRERRRRFDATDAVDLHTAGGERVAVQRVEDTDAGEVRLYCYSESRARKEEGINARFAQRFEAALQAMHEGLSRPRTTKRIDKLWERIGRLKEKSRGAGQHYHIEIVADAAGEQAQAIRWERRPVAGSMDTHPGVYCLRTNELGWDGEQLWRTYIMLTDLEAVFRSLKSELGLRPIFHHKEERADGHLFITVLAYQFVQLIRRREVRAGHPRELEAPARDIQRPGTRDRDLPPPGRPCPACAQDHAGRARAASHLPGPRHRPQSGRGTQDARLSRRTSKNRAFVVPLADFLQSNSMNWKGLRAYPLNLG
jgi:transposase